MSDVNTVIDWFKGIFSSLFNIIFDLSDDKKIFVFVLPTLVILGLILIFDYILPIIYDWREYKLNITRFTNFIKRDGINQFNISRIPFLNKSRIRLLNSRKLLSGVALGKEIQHTEFKRLYRDKFKTEFNRMPTPRELDKYIEFHKYDDEINALSDKGEVKREYKGVKGKTFD